MPRSPTRSSQRRRPSRAKDSQRSAKVTDQDRVVLLLNKPYGVLSQFSDGDGHPGLGHYIDVPGVYPCGRLDRDSEGLLVLTNDGKLQHRISDPKHKQPKTYWVQVEGEMTQEAIQKLQAGVELKDGLTKPAKCRLLGQDEAANLWPRDPPIRERKNIPTSWIELKITEGRNRQVRRMTAAVGFPTLRLVRQQVAGYQLNGLTLGDYHCVQ